MKKRNLYLIIFLLMLISWWGCSSNSGKEVQETATASRKPNIIYILADDLGYGDLSCYGQQNLRHPILIN